MDRLDAMAVFVAVADEGSLAAAGRRLGVSAAGVTRAVALLEARTGARLLHRTTRSVRLTPAGEAFLATCRHVLAELAGAEQAAAGERAAVRGVLALSAPLAFGKLHVRPVVDGFIDAHPAVQVRLLLLDRVVNLVEEGMDAAVRIGALPDSGLTALRLGSVQRVVCASPAYLARRGAPAAPADLDGHDCVVFAQEAGDPAWIFGAGARRVRVTPRLAVNNAEAAVESACEGHGITRVMSYQAERALRDGRLVRLLKRFEPPSHPVQIVLPEARLLPARTRAFVDFAAPRLRAVLEGIGEVLK